MNLFLTGGTGFLGRRAVELLRLEGHNIFALSRSQKSDAQFAQLGAVPIRGSLDGSPLVLPQVDAIVHAAAHFKLSGDPSLFFQTNVEGTKALLAAANAASVKHFIYVSAAGIVMPDRGVALRNVDENAPSYPNSCFPYVASKARAEALVLGANQPGFRTIALRPPAIWGRGDVFSQRLPEMVRKRQFGFINGGKFLYVTCHVDNVVEAISCALTSQHGGRAYFINDTETVVFREFVSGIAEALGVDVRGVPSLPYGVAYGVGAVMEKLWPLFGATSEPPLTTNLVRFLGQEFTTRDQAARRDLAYSGRVSRGQGLAGYALQA